MAPAKKVLLTGPTGFIGRFVLEELIDRGCEVHCLNFNDSPHLKHERVFTHQFNLLDIEALGAKLESLLEQTGAKQCIHLAWYTGHSDYLTSEVNQSWLEASKRFTNGFYKGSGERLVAAGTCIEYDLSLEQVCVEGSTPLKPDTLYAQCKVELQQHLESVATANGKSWGWGRIFFVYGPQDRPQRLIPYIIRQLQKDEMAEPHFGGLKRDFVLVTDVARYFCDLLESEFSGCVNFGSGEISSVQQVFDTVGEILGKPNLIGNNSNIGTSGTEQRLIAADMSAFRARVNNRKSTSLIDGIRQTTEWFLGNK